MKSQLIGKDPDAGKAWRQNEKGAADDEMFRQHHWSTDMYWANFRRQWRIEESGGLQVWSLVWEDSTYHGATKAMCHHESKHPRAHVLQQEKPLQWEAQTQLEEAHVQQQRPNANKNK